MKKTIAALLVFLGIMAATTVFAAELNGIVTDKDGKPLATKLVLKAADGAQAGEPVSSDKNGAYTFKDIKPGSYQVLINDKDEGKIFVGPGSTRRDFRLK